MAYTQLKTDYENDALNTAANNNVKYVMVDNGDGTVSLEDATSYTTLGDSLDASVINGITTVVNAIGTDVTQAKADIITNANDIDDLEDGLISLDVYAQAGTVDGDLYAAIPSAWRTDVII